MCYELEAFLLWSQVSPANHRLWMQTPHCLSSKQMPRDTGSNFVHVPATKMQSLPWKFRIKSICHHAGDWQAWTVPGVCLMTERKKDPWDPLSTDGLDSCTEIGPCHVLTCCTLCLACTCICMFVCAGVHEYIQRSEINLGCHFLRYCPPCLLNGVSWASNLLSRVTGLYMYFLKCTHSSYICVYACWGQCMGLCLWMPAESRGVGSLGAEL